LNCNVFNRSLEYSRASGLMLELLVWDYCVFDWTLLRSITMGFHDCVFGLTTVLDYSVLDSGVPRLVYDSASCLVVGLFLSPSATPRYQLFLSPPSTPYYQLFLSPPSTPYCPLFLSPPATPNYPLFLSPSPVIFCTTIRSSISAQCQT